jgi:tetratricopeptide (TPR) repeat protein
MAMGTCLLAQRRRRFGVAVAICLLASPGRAGASGVSEGAARSVDKEAKQEAKARFVSGQSHYNLNEFTLALVDFKEAYRLLPDPVFLYNLGQCERQLGHLEEAIRFYRSFLREQPRAPNRQDVVHKIDEMEVSLKAKQAEADRNVAPPVETEASAATASAGEESKQAAPAADLSPPSRPAPAAQPEPAPAPPPAPIPLGVSAVKPELAESDVGRTDLTTAPVTPAASESPAFYSHWWFWTAAGVAVAGAAVGIYAASATQSPAVPGSTLGSKRVF